MSCEHWGRDVETRLNNIAGEVEQYVALKSPRFNPAVLARFEVAFPRLYRANAMLHELNLLLSGDNDNDSFCAAFDQLLLPPGAENFDAGTAPNVDQRVAAAADEISQHYGDPAGRDKCCEILKKHMSALAGDAVAGYAVQSRDGGFAAVSLATGNLAVGLMTKLEAKLVAQRAETARLRAELETEHRKVSEQVAAEMTAAVFANADAVKPNARAGDKGWTDKALVLTTSDWTQSISYARRDHSAEDEESVKAARMEADRLRQVMARTNDAICQTLAQALGGYFWFKDDQVNFPGATEANGVLIVEQTAEDLAELVAKRIKALNAVGPLLDELQASCGEAGRYGADYFDDVRRVRAKIDAILAGKSAEGGAA